MSKLIDTLIVAPHGITMKFIDRENKALHWNAFFKPATKSNDPEDKLVFKACTVITAPLASFIFALMLCKKSFSEAYSAYEHGKSGWPYSNELKKRALRESKESMKTALFLLLLIPLSPIINLIDLIGSSVNTLKEHIKSVFDEGLSAAP